MTPSSLPSRGARPHLPDGVTVGAAEIETAFRGIHSPHAERLKRLGEWVPDPLTDPERHTLWVDMWNVIVTAEAYTQATYTRSETDGSWTPVYKARERMELYQRVLITRIEFV